MSANKPLSEHPAYANLEKKANQLRSASVANMLEEDSERVHDFSLGAVGLRLDFSKQLLDREGLALLLDLALQADLPGQLSRQFAGEHVNCTENRPALHTLLRAEQASGLEDLFQEVLATRARMESIANDVNSGARTGFTGEAFTDVVNIGIGGSDLGPRLVSEALIAYQGRVRCHYVANVDPADICNTLQSLNPRTTLFIICSKSFRTEETLANALAARSWMLDAGATIDDLDCHFLGVTTNLEAAAEFGISATNCLPMWDWVGGRYSVWSAVGLSCAIALGWENFSLFLGGARALDDHCRDSSPESNLPVLLALLEIWCCNFLGVNTHVVLPYDHSLQNLPNYLQQLTMESNGKQVSLDGQPLDYTSAPVLWGSAGTIGQHSFHQLLHQGTRLCSVDFIVPLSTHTELAEQHRRLVANGLAQSRTLMVGRSLAEAEAALLAKGMSEEKALALAPHMVMPGNRPNNVITMAMLTPASLGALLALYEHRTYCSAQLWNINAFDQWGVELGKEIGVEILDRLCEEDGQSMDASTEALIDAWRSTQD